MIQGIILNTGMTFFLMWAPLVFSQPGPLFKMIANGESSANINMTMCLNGQGSLSCQNYTVTNLNLYIKTTIPNKTYLNAGIRINTPGYTLANTQCTPNASGFCLFSVNDQTSSNLLLTPLVPPAPPGIPTNVTATAAGDASAKINWSPPVDTTSIANYIITPYSLTTSTSLPSTACPNTPDFCTVHNLTNGLPYTFSVQAQNSGGDSASSTASNQVNPPAWTYSYTANFSGISSPGLLSSVSCTGSNFCMAIGYDQNYTNFACSYVNQVWDCNSVLGHSTYDQGTQFQSVSCVNPDFCMAVDLYGAAFLYSGDTPSWSSPTTITASSNNYLNSVSCPDANFCMAVDNQGDAYAFNNGIWSSGVLVTIGTALNAVSCSSQTSCTAVDANGNAYSFNGTVWGSAPSTPTNQGLSSVSCPINSPDTFCMVGGTDNNNDATAYIYTQTNPTWTTTALGSQAINSALYSVSCASDQFCMAIIGSSVYNYSGNTPTWDTGNNLAYMSYLTAVSCANANFCMSVDIYGNAYIYTNSVE